MGWRGRAGGTSMVVAGGGWLRRRQAALGEAGGAEPRRAQGGGGGLRRRQEALRQAEEQNRRRPQAVNRRWQTGQMIVPVSSRDGRLGDVGSGAPTASRCPPATRTLPVGAASSSAL